MKHLTILSALLTAPALAHPIKECNDLDALHSKERKELTADSEPSLAQCAEAREQVEYICEQLEGAGGREIRNSLLYIVALPANKHTLKQCPPPGWKADEQA